MKPLFLLIFPALLCQCVMLSDEIKSLPVTEDFIGTWEQTENCDVPEVMKGPVIIRKSPEKSGLIEIRWNHSKEFSAMNGVGAFNYSDFEDKKYRISLDTEVYDEGKVLVTATIWKLKQGDSKNLAMIMKKYHLETKDQLIYEKFGYTSFEEKGKFQLKPYSNWFPKNYRCVMTRIGKK